MHARKMLVVVVLLGPQYTRATQLKQEPIDFELQHDLNGDMISFTRRGTVLVEAHSVIGQGETARIQGVSAMVSNEQWSANDLKLLQQLIDNKGIYRVRLVPLDNKRVGGTEKMGQILSSVPACLLTPPHQEGITHDKMVIHMDAQQNALSLEYFVQSHKEDGSFLRHGPCTESNHINNLNLETEASVRTSRRGPRARLEPRQRKDAAQAKQAEEEPKGFLQKYWMYIVPAAIFFLMGSGAPPSDQPAANAGRAAQQVRR